MTRRELRDSELALIEPFLTIGRYGPYPQHVRDQFEGVIWWFRNGSRWREVPEEFGSWQTVYDRFTLRPEVLAALERAAAVDEGRRKPSE